MVDNLITALTLADEEFDEEVVRMTRHHNKSVPEFTDKAVLSKELEDKIIASEQWVIERYYD